MRQPVQKSIASIFLILVIIDIIGITAQFDLLHFIVKPLLIPTLLLLLFYTRSNLSGKTLLFTGLIFSWLGDVFLLFEFKNSLFFIAGLISFLTTHLFYIVYFLKIKSTKPSLLKKHPILIALVLGYGITLVWQLYPHLTDLKIPVMIYAAVICLMLICSLHIFLKVNKRAGTYYLLGATSFVISDSLLAINKFYQPFLYAGVFIMLTYCAAQYFIVLGFIKQDNA